MVFYRSRNELIIFNWIAIILYVCPICFSCSIITSNSGSLSNIREKSYNIFSDCWTIPVQGDTYATIEIQELLFEGDCYRTYVEIKEAVTNKTERFCTTTNNKHIIRALNNITIRQYHDGSTDWYRRSSFQLRYFKESIICTRTDHFRCSDHQCIHRNRVCDRVDDCENGSDESDCERGIAAVEGVKIIQNIATKWLMEKAVAYGWGKNTHRAITALYLAKVDYEPKRNESEKQLKDELRIKQLELKTLVAILRNSTEPISISDLGMFVNALILTCHNPRQFYGYDLIEILYERVSFAETPYPGAYLTLCSSDWMLTEFDVKYLFDLLEKTSDFPFLVEIQAMSIMALSCIKNKYENYENLFNNSSIYNETIEKFIESQLSDGSFGNIYTTAWITQALISCGQEENKQWNVTATVQYFKNYFNSEPLDFLLVYLSLPLFSSKSLVDVGNRNCLNFYRKQENDISDVTERLHKKMLIQYSLCIGDEGDVIHTIYLRIPKNSSVYDLMRVAQATDPKYKFLHRFIGDRMYVYQIAGITNDPETGKFWLLYTKDNEQKTIKNHTESPDKLFLKDGEHLVMWYKTTLI